MIRRLCVVAAFLLLCGPAQAQRVQNMDNFTMFGATLPTSSVNAAAATSFGYGYQILRKSAASVWAEFSMGFGGGSHSETWMAVAPALRLMAPLQNRVALYALAGGGVGSFKAMSADADPRTRITWHGIFETGGGADVRLARMFSIRLELRDHITGRELSGVSGRHHPVASVGFSIHY